MFRIFKKRCTPEEQVDAVLALLTKKERDILMGPKINVRRLVLDKIDKKTKQKFKTIEEAVDAGKSLLDLAQLDTETIEKYDGYDTLILASELFKGLFED